MRDKKPVSEAERLQGFYKESREELLEAYKEAGSWGGALRLLLEQEATEEQLESLEQETEAYYQSLRERGASEESIARLKKREEERDELPSEYVEPEFWAALIDLIEESRGSKIADAKELQELTGLTEYSLEELDKWLILGREFKYGLALYKAIDSGAKYAEMIKIEPSDYGLPAKWDGYWSGHRQAGKERAVVDIICWQYGLPEWDLVRPSPRAVAEATGAPYPLILEAMGYFHKGGL